MCEKHILFVETVLCAAVGAATHQHVLEACTVYGDSTVCSCRYSKTSTCVRSIYCFVETVLCAAVGTARHQHLLGAYTVCGDRTVCSCRYSKLSTCVRSIYCLWRPYCVQLYVQQDINMC